MKILSTEVGVDACGQYRIRKPLKGLETYCGDIVHIWDPKKDDVKELVKALPEFDVIIMRPGAEVFKYKLADIPELSKLKAKWVMDIDDNVDYISPYSQFYSNYGIREFKHGDIDVWKDGNNGFNIQANYTRLNSLKRAMGEVDLVTVTTEKLAEHAREFNQNVYVNDNTIDFNHWWRLNNKQTGRLKIVWQGSPSHYSDWYAIKEPLNKLMDEFDFEVIMLGSQYSGIFDKKHLKRVRALPWVHFDAHSYRMMSLQADIGLIPLADEPFNWYKSSIKWYENAAMGLPSVVSNILPYSESIEDGKTALAYKTPKEFYNQTKKLLTNKGLRANIANAAYEWVKNNKTLELESKKFHEALENLCKSQ